MRANMLVFLVCSVALAGCVDSTPGEGSGEPAPGDNLAAGKGAIAGLVIDDRFRPIPGASVLLQEKALTTTSNDNGEFEFRDITPGVYTLRVTAEGHEGAPRQVKVEAGAFAEANLIARRIASSDGFIISNEYAAFVPCGANLVYYGDSFDCTLDQSGDSERVKFTFDYTPYNATHLVMEMRSNQAQYWDIWLQPPLDDAASCDETYQIMGGPDSTYERWQLNRGEIAVSSPTASGVDCEPIPWNNEGPIQTYVYVNSLGFEEGVGFGAGIYYGLQANFVQVAFIGEPNEDVDSFCAYCAA